MMDISIALGGGGAKGNSHIGVLRRLEKEGYRIRAVAGTSFGGLVASFYAAGRSPNEIEEIFCNVDQSTLYTRHPGEGPSLLGLSRVNTWLDEVLGEVTFDELKIPCVMTAVDLNQGSEVILSKGRVKDAVLSTIALPGIFPPFRMNGWELVDGGVLDPVPVAQARKLAPRLPVVAVVLNQPLGEGPQTWSMPMPSILPRLITERLSRLNFAQAMDIFMRSMQVESRAVTEYRLRVDQPEVVIRPNVDSVGVLDHVDVHEIAKLGEEATELVLPDLKRAVAWPARLGRLMRGNNET
ncbi:MAG TPA: patatin-like phospholipase family protein [Anaerolineales bacterium]|nr:patatin-like phospholipase family protein [Anaerolineales bacterium]